MILLKSQNASSWCMGYRRDKFKECLNCQYFCRSLYWKEICKLEFYKKETCLKSLVENARRSACSFPRIPAWLGTHANCTCLFFRLGRQIKYLVRRTKRDKEELNGLFYCMN